MKHNLGKSVWMLPALNAEPLHHSAASMSNMTEVLKETC